MLMEVKKSLKLMAYYFKFNLSAALEYRVSFLIQAFGMFINNTAFIFFWWILFSNVESIGGYGFSDVMMLWALSSSSFGVYTILFGNIPYITRMILNGELDSYLLQPKDPLINIISSRTQISGWGDFIYGIVLFFIINGFDIKKILLFSVLIITGAIFFAALLTTIHSLSFYTGNSQGLAELATEFMISFSIYPEGIFNSAIRVILYTLIPSAFIAYIPLAIINSFSIGKLVLVIGVAIIWIIIAYTVFYKGLKKYESGNLIISKL